MNKDLVVKTGTYRDKGTGTEKGEYTKIGTMLESENGEYILMDIGVDLAGLYIKQSKMNREAGKETKGASLMVGVYARESRMNQDQGQNNQQPNNNFDDDLDF